MKKEDLLNTKIRIEDSKQFALVVHKLDELGFSLRYMTPALPAYIIIDEHPRTGSNIKNFEESAKKEVFFVGGEFTFIPKQSKDSVLYVSYGQEFDRWWPNAKVIVEYNDYIVFVREGKDKPFVRHKSHVKFKEFKEPSFKIGQTIQHRGGGCMFVELTDNGVALINLEGGTLIGREIEVNDPMLITYAEFKQIYKGIEDNCLL